MAIYRRVSKGKTKSKFYWTKFYFNGQLVQQSTKCTSLAKAREFEAALKTQLNFGRIGLDSIGAGHQEVQRLDAAVTDFLAWSSDHQKSSTAARYVTSSKPLITFFRKCGIDEVDRKAVERYINWRQFQKRKAPARKLKSNPRAVSKIKIKPATVNRELALLRIVFNRLIDQGVVLKNPVKGVKFLSENNLQTRVVSKTDLNEYLVAASQPLRDVAIVMYETGMRPSEVFSLRDENVDFELGRIMIVDGKTKAARRRLTMTQAARNVLISRYRATTNGLLFAGGKKGQDKRHGDWEKPILKVTNAHKAALARSGVKPFRLYDLRHTFATEFLAAGGDLVTLAAILGHSNLAMVTRYAHPTEQHQADAFEKLERFRSGRVNVLSFRHSA